MHSELVIEIIIVFSKVLSSALINYREILRSKSIRVVIEFPMRISITGKKNMRGSSSSI